MYTQLVHGGDALRQPLPLTWCDMFETYLAQLQYAVWRYLT